MIVDEMKRDLDDVDVQQVDVKRVVVAIVVIIVVVVVGGVALTTNVVVFPMNADIAETNLFTGHLRQMKLLKW